MKHLLSTTAIMLLTALPLQAEQHGGAASDMSVMVGEAEIQVEALSSASVFMPGENSDATVGANMDLQEIPSDWTEIGSVEDIYVTADGKIATLVVAPSDAAETDANRVGLEADSFTLAKLDGEDGRVAVIFTGDMATFQGAGEFDQAKAEEEGEMSAMPGMDSPDEMAEDLGDAAEGAADAAGDAVGDAADAVGATTDDAAATAEETGRELTVDTPVDREALTAEDLDGISVYEPSGDSVGEISEIVLTEDGKIDKIVVDVGGFLGIGEKPVALAFDELEISRDDSMNGLRVEISYSQEELEGMEDWEG